MKILPRNMSFSVMLLAYCAMQQMGVSAWVLGITGSAALGVVALIIGLGVAGMFAGHLVEAGVARWCVSRQEFKKGYIFDDFDTDYHAFTNNTRIHLIGLMVGVSALLVMSPWAAIACGFSAIYCEHAVQDKWRTMLNLAVLGLPVTALLGVTGWVLRAGMMLIDKMPVVVTAAMTARNTALATGVVAAAPMVWTRIVSWCVATDNLILLPPDTLPPPDTLLPPRTQAGNPAS